MVIVENLQGFFNTLKNKDREFWFREEVISQQRIGLKRMQDRSLKELVSAPKLQYKLNRLRGVQNYDILTNPLYSDRFLYTPCCYHKRADYTISEYRDPYMKVYSCDIVRLACDLAYLPRSQAKELEFSEESIF